MMSDEQLLLIRYLRSHGLQQGEIAQIAGLSGHQVVGYTTRKLRKAFFDKHPSILSQQAGVGSLLVGFSSDPCPPSLLAYKQALSSHIMRWLADLTKEEKVGVLLALLEEVESDASEETKRHMEGQE
jgi:DNA-binding transcriptional MerR regulator